MASHVFQGTASGHKDLYDKVIAHLTDAVTLGTEVWSLLQQTEPVANEYHSFLKAPGLSGTDNIYVNLGAYRSVGSDIYNMMIMGAISHNPLLSATYQPGASSWGHITLWQNTIPYWLVVNGRRLILVAKVSTTYATAYGGFILPYSTSAEMPYPLYVAGNTSGARRWSSANFLMGALFDPPTGAAYMRHFDGTWIPIQNYNANPDYRIELSDNVCWPWHSDYGIGNQASGDYALLPAIIHSNYSGSNVYGELQGVYFCSGFANAVENTITVAGKTYLVVQSNHRTSRRDYGAILLE